MDFAELSGALFVYALTCAIFALIGKNRTIGYGVTFLLCLLLSPAVGALVASFSEKKAPKFTEVKKEDTIINQEKTNNSDTGSTPPNKIDDTKSTSKVSQECSDTESTYYLVVFWFIMAVLSFVIMFIAISFDWESGTIVIFFIFTVVFAMFGMLSNSANQKNNRKD